MSSTISTNQNNSIDRSPFGYCRLSSYSHAPGIISFLFLGKKWESTAHDYEVLLDNIVTSPFSSTRNKDEATCRWYNRAELPSGGCVVRASKAHDRRPPGARLRPLLPLPTRFPRFRRLSVSSTLSLPLPRDWLFLRDPPQARNLHGGRIWLVGGGDARGSRHRQPVLLAGVPNAEFGVLIAKQPVSTERNMGYTSATLSFVCRVCQTGSVGGASIVHKPPTYFSLTAP